MTASATPPELTRLQRIRKWIAGTLCCAGVLVLLIFIVSRRVTDRWLFTQYAFWAPEWCYLLVATVLAAMSAMAFRSTRPRLRQVNLWTLGACVVIALGSWVSRWPRHGAAHTGETLRIVHWNMSSPDMLGFAGTLADFPACRDADVILLGVTVSEDQLRGMVAGLGPQWQHRRLGVFAIVSRYRISKAQIHPLGLDNSALHGRDTRFQDFYNIEIADRFGFSRREFDLPDPGYVLDYAVETPRGTLSLRAIDLPSNPFRGRMEIAEAAARIIGELERAGRLTAAPAVIIGDTNIPRGSHALTLLAPGMVHAGQIAESTDKGATWPRAKPLLEIDHAWVRPGISVQDYLTFDGGISDHRGLRLVLDPQTIPRP